ncbi:MAG TPA: DUF3592 domain-containing protein [Tepidisphaeraceae bacterium]|jgi:hypothetical protein
MIGLYVIAGMIFLGIVALFVYYFSPSTKMTVPVVAEVMRCEERETRTESNRVVETVVTCSYRAQGKDYQVEHVMKGRQSERYPAGKKLRVLYNPEDPGMARVG